MPCTFTIVDVFVDAGTGGNPLAVVFGAEHLSTQDMQHIAREFNFSETTFVLPTTREDADYRVRIFTPTKEVPFAGHPNLGTAFALLHRDNITVPGKLCFDELAGLVPVTFDAADDDDVELELRAPEPLTVGPAINIEDIASVLSLAPADIDVQTHSPCEASVGLPFLMCALASESALDRASVDAQALRALEHTGVTADLHCYHRRADGSIEARMFAPFDGVPEDPATGSANAALVALLTQHAARDGKFEFAIRQGFAMGRPSRLRARTERREGQVSQVFIGGRCRVFATGTLRD
ncbi:MAG: PhzF family phenazine biosynthesis protein [Pseudomonadota bacterium]